MPIERALFVVGPQDSGKSTQLRAMFLDRRLHTDGEIPDSAEKRNLAETYYLSNDRQLFLRLMSPHEYGDTPEEWLKKIRDKTSTGRWCVAGALQPESENDMPDILTSLDSFIEEFDPERVRVIFLSPTRHGVMLTDYANGLNILADLLEREVEVACIDARNRVANGLFLADFFDYS